MKLHAMEERKIMTMKTLEEITKKVEHVNYHYTQAEKRIKVLDKEVAEYKIKSDGMSEELMISQTQCRNATAELFRIKNGYDDAQAKLEDVKKENICLATEIKDMEDSFELTKINHTKTLESIQQNLESISKAKAEAYRDKQNLEQTVIEIDGALNQSQMKSLDLNNIAKKLQDQIKNKTIHLEAETDAKEVASANLIGIERKLNSVKNSLEEGRSLLEQADRARRQNEQDLADTNEHLNELSSLNSSLLNAVRKLHGELSELRIEKQDVHEEVLVIEEKAKSYMMEAANLADELRSEQENSSKAEACRKETEAKIRELQIKVDDEEMNAIKR